MTNSCPPTVHFATQTDAKFLIPTLVMATSAKENMHPSSHYHFHLFYDNLEPWHKEAVMELASPQFEVSLHEVSDGRHLKFRQRFHVPSIALVRLSLPENLPTLDRVLYLDGDVVVHSDLTELYSVDMGKNLIAAVKAPLPLAEKDYVKSFPSSIYINSGVMVMNLAQMREDSLVEKFFEAKASPHPKWRFQDQDVINFCCAGRVVVLPPRYNGMSRLFQPHFLRNSAAFNRYYETSYTSILELERDYVLTHWAGYPNTRPWEISDAVCSSAWLYYFMRSPMRNVNLNLRTPWESIKKIENVLKQQSETKRSQRPDWGQTATYGFCRILPVFTIKTSYNSESSRTQKMVKLFGFVPLLSAKGTGSKLTWRLFSFIPIWRSERKMG